MLKIEQQAWVNAPGSKAARRRSDYGAGRSVSGAGGSRRLAEEPGQRGQVGPDSRRFRPQRLKVALRLSEALRAR